MSTLDVRVGDVVLVKLKVALAAKGCCPAVQCLRGGNILTVEPDDIESIISRAETPQETIARLEAELAKAPRRIEWSGGECPVGPLTFVTVWVSNGNISTNRANTYRWTHSAEIGWNNIIAYMELPS